MGLARQHELEARRLLLQQRSQQLRTRLGEESVALQRPLAAADAVRGSVRWIAAHPQWIVAAAAVPIVLRPRRALGWALKLWWGWRAWQRLRDVFATRSAGR